MNSRPALDKPVTNIPSPPKDPQPSARENPTADELIAHAAEIYRWGQELSAQYKSLVALGTSQSSGQHGAGNDIAREREIKGLSLQSSISHLQAQLDHANAQVAAFQNASTWRMTAPIRASVRLTRKMIALAKQEGGAVSRFRRRSPAMSDAQNPSSGQDDIDSSKPLHSVHVVHTPHTQFIADLLTSSLRRYGLRATASLDMPTRFNETFYIVVCPQMFTVLPPPEKLICYQLEQSTSSRWLHGRYIEILRNSRAVLDYSMRNIRYLDALGISYPKVFYTPISSLASYGEILSSQGIHLDHNQEKTTDILFYGDNNVGRRKAILEKLSQNFNIKVINNLFGPELLKEIRKSKVVLNLHYYSEALLESTRIYECLSLGVPVVSESVIDADEHEALSGLVSFARSGDVADLTEKLHEALADAKPLDEVRIGKLSASFTFHIGRLLLTLGLVDFKLFSERCRDYSFPSDRIALSLPETWRRRRFLHKYLDKDTFVFDGVRATPGWVGAAASYKFIAERLLEQGIDRAMIYEDDADFVRYTPAQIHAFVDQIEAHFGEWDVISGFMGDLHPDAKIDKIITINGEHCVSLDKMVSSVCNIYNRRALERIANWNHHNLHVSNTIDRYLENQSDLRIITASPFLVDHNESLDSSLWSVTNAAMRVMIENSRRTLSDKVWYHQALEFLRKSEATPPDLRP